jgi:pimeloyl-ACP methyl ester carboxylesterase
VTLNDLRACDTFDVMDRLGEIRLPLLALCGDEDTMTPPKYSHFLAEKIPTARAVVVSGGTHMVFAEKPAEVNAAIDEFVREIQSR